MAKIIFIGGPCAGRMLELAGDEVVLGAGADADVVIADDAVAVHHAQLVRHEGRWRVRDLFSGKGTQVNGAAVELRDLDDGDTVLIGGSQFVFRDEAPGAAAGTALESPAVAAAAAADDVALVEQMSERTRAIRAEVGQTIVGQREVLDQILMCLLAGGHGLLIGLPGMAKTLMVRTVGQVLDLAFKRVQFTPDLMPSDITGTEVLEVNRATGEKEFRFIPGPIFCNLLLADEINRTPPKTQAALLQAMQELRVTAGNVTHELESPFFVLATQNPIEQEGTYPLPEAQLDRFMFNIWVDYPLAEEEEEIVTHTTAGPAPVARRILTRGEVLQLQEVVRKIPVSPHVIKYVIRLVRATRPQYADSPAITKSYVSTGAGPRASQYLVLAAKARAVIEGRIHVSCRDIREAAAPVLRHRILTNFAADSEGLTSMDIIRKLLAEVAEPGEKDY